MVGPPPVARRCCLHLVCHPTILVLQEVYGHYCDDMRKLHDTNPMASRTNCASFVYFSKVWRRHFPTLKVKPRGDFMMCTVSTRLKEHLHGAPGQRRTLDMARADQY